MVEVTTVLLVCLGDLCRSPMAQLIFKEEAENIGVSKSWKVESSYFSPAYLRKSTPSPQTMQELKDHNVNKLYRAKPRQFDIRDFNKYDYILSMEQGILEELKKMQPPETKAKVVLLGTFDPKLEGIIHDIPPEDMGFGKFYRQCQRACRSFLKRHLP